MKRWKVWVALRRSKGMKRYTNKPNGVIIAVLTMSWVAIGSLSPDLCRRRTCSSAV
jgi:hypothetical protein